MNNKYVQGSNGSYERIQNRSNKQERDDYTRTLLIMQLLSLFWKMLFKISKKRCKAGITIQSEKTQILIYAVLILLLEEKKELEDLNCMDQTLYTNYNNIVNEKKVRVLQRATRTTTGYKFQYQKLIRLRNSLC